MRKAFLYICLILVCLAIGGFIFKEVMITQTKKHSPQVEEVYKEDGNYITINYSSPYKKGRVIFGNLVPYGHVWRTGANEPTVFNTSTDLEIDGKTLPKGKYTLWTIPESDNWTIIFNKELNDWGVSFGGKASRVIEQDVLKVKVPVEHLSKAVESFLIDVSKGEESKSMFLVFEWDNVRTKLKMKTKE
ncbi:DUF2911 domain-containing protein [Flammeovirga yaeyamensis]|uniref:DUF2911 domain-containing protein n=1 Tax=Flammeovirga yaeyamensis TaxID=367791 RepID=A0AAX1N187_9BACT|nr:MULTISPECIES: DUF2911 domain-containing protein [Flammeovirga]ANQ51237.1 DUF2911 domain-containing protein [Flammeovirga sp. MY04]MBB3698294.1 hypothetical protein [Flammeovirga yaeyamensis]NMF34353.1 DUF2911 domain-containing protein [Flammeovirga yaeyamensis]QWG01334.1 DUF2911 domain-containing protein [Flammeovirga yaeyamensis]